MSYRTSALQWLPKPMMTMETVMEVLGQLPPSLPHVVAGMVDASTLRLHFLAPMEIVFMENFGATFERMLPMTIRVEVTCRRDVVLLPGTVGYFEMTIRVEEPGEACGTCGTRAVRARRCGFCGARG